MKAYKLIEIFRFTCECMQWCIKDKTENRYINSSDDIHGIIARGDYHIMDKNVMKVTYKNKCLNFEVI